MSNILKMFARGGAIAAPTDEYFNQTTLLLHGDGTNGAQNNTFLDSSTNTFTITRNGNTTQGTFSPFSLAEGQWSNYFGSNTANLKFASNAAFAIGTGNFTVECFVNFDAWASTNQRILMQDVNGGSNLQIGRDSGANNLFVVITGSTVINYSWSPTVGEFYHIAVVRSGTGTNEVALYIDGVSVATGTSNGSISQQQVIVGGLDWATSYNVQGYISNFRYSNVARTITLPTAPYTSDANTLILTCQSNRFVDNSGTPKTITVNGNTSVQPFSPFAPSAAYDPSVNGGSGYFDGTGDYLSVADNAAFDLGTDNFTIQGWVYLTATSGSQQTLCAKGTGADNQASYHIALNGSTWVYYLSGSGSAWSIASGVSMGASAGLNTWQHIALVRSGSTFTPYVNGVAGTTTTSATALFDSNKIFSIGSDDPGGQRLTGYISGLQVLKGTAATITVPTTPPTNIANTSLLLLAQNAGIFDNTGKNNLETVGNAQIDTSVKKYGTGSMEFDGTGDYLKAPNSRFFDLGSGDFTLEFWAYHNSITSPVYQMYCGQFNSGGTTPGWNIYKYTNGEVQFYAAGGTPTLTSSNVLTAGTWNHIAVTRSGSSLKLFINGVEEASTTNTSFSDETSNSFYIGARSDVIGTYDMNGYIDDLRITKGVARYTAAFTPPTAAFPDL